MSSTVSLSQACSHLCRCDFAFTVKIYIIAPLRVHYPNVDLPSSVADPFKQSHKHTSVLSPLSASCSSWLPDSHVRPCSTTIFSCAISRDFYFVLYGATRFSPTLHPRTCCCLVLCVYENASVSSHYQPFNLLCQYVYHLQMKKLFFLVSFSFERSVCSFFSKSVLFRSCVPTQLTRNIANT